MLKELMKYNVIDKLSDLFKNGWYISSETGLITCSRAIEKETPWDYVRQCPERNGKCRVYQAIFNGCGFIPEFCLSCWKVVVKPRTIQELFSLLELQQYQTAHYCKCGIELRDYVPGLYGGYFYNNSKDEGERCYNAIRGLVSEQISPDVPVILKRYCTEFEIRKGDSKGYQRPADAGAVETEIWAAIDPDVLTPACPQPLFVKDKVHLEWLKFAGKNDPVNAMRYNNGEPFYTQPRKYLGGDR